MSQGMNKVREIHANLWEISNEDQEVTWEEIEEQIRKLAGLDRRTIKKYSNILRETSRVEQQKNGNLKVNKPENLDSELEDTERTTVNPKISRDLRDKAKKFDISMSAALEEAIADKIASLKDYVELMLDGEYSEQEANLIFEFITEDLHKKGLNRRVEDRKEVRRRDLYKNYMNKDYIEDAENLENLRRKAFEMAEAIGVEKPPA